MSSSALSASSAVEKPVIAVDWDGTCIEQVWPLEGDWLPGAPEALARLTTRFTVFIWTTRILGVEYTDWSKRMKDADEHIARETAYIRRMLDDAGLKKVHIWSGKYPVGDSGKISAVAYIDDKAIHHTDWETSLETLEKRLSVKLGKKHLKPKSSMYLESTAGMSPRAIRNKVNGFIKD